MKLKSFSKLKKRLQLFLFFSGEHFPLSILLKILKVYSSWSNKNWQRKIYAQFLKEEKVKIKYLNIELTNICNLNCRYCILDNTSPKGFMEIELFKKILKEIKTPEILIKELPLYDAGESLLHPEFGEFLELISKEKKTNKNFPRVVIQTNATVLNKEMQKLILESSALDEISFSIDGGNKKDFQYLRVGAVWEKVIENCFKFIDLNSQMGKKMKVGMISIFQGSPNYSPEFKSLIKKADNYWPIRPHVWDGSKEFPDLKFKKISKNSFCNSILQSLIIKWDGKVYPCCNDLNRKGIIGDFNKQSLKEIYFGESRRAMLENMAKGKRQKNPLCQNCTM